MSYSNQKTIAAAMATFFMISAASGSEITNEEIKKDLIKLEVDKFDLAKKDLINHTSTEGVVGVVYAFLAHCDHSPVKIFSQLQEIDNSLSEDVRGYCWLSLKQEQDKINNKIKMLKEKKELTPIEVEHIENSEKKVINDENLESIIINKLTENSKHHLVQFYLGTYFLEKSPKISLNYFGKFVENQDENDDILIYLEKIYKDENASSEIRIRAIDFAVKYRSNYSYKNEIQINGDSIFKENEYTLDLFDLYLKKIQLIDEDSKSWFNEKSEAHADLISYAEKSTEDLFRLADYYLEQAKNNKEISLNAGISMMMRSANQAYLSKLNKGSYGEDPHKKNNAFKFILENTDLLVNAFGVDKAIKFFVYHKSVDGLKKLEQTPQVKTHLHLLIDQYDYHHYNEEKLEDGKKILLSAVDQNYLPAFDLLINSLSTKFAEKKLTDFSRDISKYVKFLKTKIYIKEIDVSTEKLKNETSNDNDYNFFLSMKNIPNLVKEALEGEIGQLITKKELIIKGMNDKELYDTVFDYYRLIRTSEYSIYGNEHLDSLLDGMFMTLEAVADRGYEPALDFAQELYSKGYDKPSYYRYSENFPQKYGNREITIVPYGQSTEMADFYKQQSEILKNTDKGFLTRAKEFEKNLVNKPKR